MRLSGLSGALGAAAIFFFGATVYGAWSDQSFWHGWCLDQQRGAGVLRCRGHRTPCPGVLSRERTSQVCQRHALSSAGSARAGLGHGADTAADEEDRPLNLLVALRSDRARERSAAWCHQGSLRHVPLKGEPVVAGRCGTCGDVVESWGQTLAGANSRPQLSAPP